MCNLPKIFFQILFPPPGEYSLHPKKSSLPYHVSNVSDRRLLLYVRFYKTRVLLVSNILSLCSVTRKVTVIKCMISHVVVKLLDCFPKLPECHSKK